MPDATPLVTALEGAGYRLTAPRRAMAQLIADRDGSFTAADIAVDARARRLGIGRATIFRTLDVLAELRVLERLELPDGEHAYVPCAPRHHHHLVCGRCGRAEDVEDCGVGAVAREVERRTGYAIAEHRLELYGLCPPCRASGS